jgi:hypothetical protein
MIIKQVKTWKIAELTAEQKQKAIRNYCGINTEHDWWDSVYDDAKQIGLKITEFDTGRGDYIKGELIESAPDCAKLIIENHGEKCETYKTAQIFLKRIEPYKDLDSDSLTQFQEEEREEIAADFEKQILRDYLRNLREELDYLSCDAAIIETFESNDYDFTESGKIF